MPTPSGDDLLRTAFRDMHAVRLHGFALLVALGDREAAASAASRALLDGSERLHELRHPERAAAWLRASVVRSLRRQARRAPSEAAIAAVRGLGVTDAVAASLSALSLRERAALVASTVERFTPADVDAILGVGPRRGRRLVTAARQRYLASFDGASADILRPGSLAERVMVVAARGFAPRSTRSEPSA
jgi:DNA-directed RNA polymerase specialized sigma24 family protein